MINEKLAYKIYRLRKGDNRYCFPLRMFLGENGLIPNHELKGKTFIEIETGVEFIVENVYAHWYKGWYYLALAVNSERSHASITWNINSEFDVSNIEHYKLKPFSDSCV